MTKRRAALWIVNLLVLVALGWVLAYDAEVAAGPADLAVAPGLRAASEPAAGGTTRSPALRNARDARLERAVERAVARAVARAEKGTQGRVHAGNVTVGVSIVELEGRAVCVARQATVALRPASSQKLVTTAAALALGGADATFETPVEGAGPLRAGSLMGDLVVRAGGDPLVGDESGRVAGRLRPLIEALRARGLERVTGGLVLDERSFPEPAPGPAWPDSSQHWQDYCALAGGFSANGGCLVATVRPGPVGGPARIEVHPADHGLTNEWRVETKAQGSLVVGLEARRGRVLVRGSFPRNVPEWSDAFAHPDPVDLFGCVLRAELERAGIAIAGSTRRERGAPGGAELARLVTPIADVLEPINTHSRNAVADQLFFATGLAASGDATRLGGALATRRALEALGVSIVGFEQVDGSGLSRDNRISAEQLSALLVAVNDRGGDRFRSLKASLAIAGETGTLERRMRGSAARGRVFAKTGFIGGTSALAGYAEGGDGRTYAFAILVDYPVHGGLNTSCWKPMQDEICKALCGDES